jgi:hypothetical protein
MAAVASVATWRPRPGRLQDFMAVVARAKKIHTRLKGNVRVWNSQFGGEPFTVGYVIEVPDWKAHGEFAAKLETDPEWLALVAEWTANREPPADLVQDALFAEVPVG